MKNAGQVFVPVSLMSACVWLGSAGCAASSTPPPQTSATTTTASEVLASPPSGEALPLTHATTSGSGGPVTAQAVGSAPYDATLTDGQVVAIASQINQAGVAAANVVLARSLSDDVRRFALLVRSGNDAVDAKLLHAARVHGIALVDSAAGSRLHSADAARKSGLTSRSGSDLDRAYLDTEVTDSESALDLLDNELIPSAINPDIKAALESTRANLVSHLHEAKRMQVSLGAM